MTPLLPSHPKPIRAYPIPSSFLLATDDCFDHSESTAGENVIVSAVRLMVTAKLDRSPVPSDRSEPTIFI